MSLVLDPAAPTDAGDDGAVVQDVLAFLDDFDQSCGGDHDEMDQPSETTTSSGADSPRIGAIDSQAGVTDASKLGRRRARAEASNRARVRRYQKKKDELHALRRQVASLTNRVELLARCARSPVQAQQTSALGVTIRRAFGSTAAPSLNWQRRARTEREMRVCSEQVNAQLRQLLCAHLERASALDFEVQRAGNDIQANVRMLLLAGTCPFPLNTNRFHAFWTPLDYHDCQLLQLLGHDCTVQRPTIQSHGTLDAEAQEAAWSYVLRQLYEEACALADLNSLDTIGNFDWADTALTNAPTKTPIEWTNSFSIPRSDPRSVGKMWWHSIQQHRFSPDSGVDLFTVRPRGSLLHQRPTCNMRSCGCDDIVPQRRGAAAREENQVVRVR